MKKRPTTIIAAAALVGVAALALVMTLLSGDALANCEPSVEIIGPAQHETYCQFTLTAEGSCPDGPCNLGDGDDCHFVWTITDGDGQFGNIFTSGQTSIAEITTFSPSVTVRVKFDWNRAGYSHTITESPWPAEGRLMGADPSGWPIGCRGSTVNVKGTLPNANYIWNKSGCPKMFDWFITPGAGDAIVTLPVSAGALTIDEDKKKLFQ